MVDAGDSKSPDGDIVWVRVPPWAPLDLTGRLARDPTIASRYNCETVRGQRVCIFADLVFCGLDPKAVCVLFLHFCKACQPDFRQILGK